MRKRITSALLTLVMLLSLIPAMGTTAAAADTTNNSLYINREYKLDDGKYITKNDPNNQKNFTGNTDVLSSADTYAALYNNTLYLKGNWGGAVGVVGPKYVKSDLTNPLNIVVMGDTTIRNLDLRWYKAAQENSGATIELRDNATLTINHTGSRDSSSAINAIYLYTADGHDRWLGSDITVKGTGTLKANANISSRQVDPFVKAGAFSITENVNLDAKVVASGDIANDQYYGFSLDKFVIDTTGYVKIDTSDYANALMLPGPASNAYQLKNASSITLTSSEKKTMFMGGSGDLVKYFIDRHCAGWKVAKSADDAKPYTLKLIPKTADFHPVKVRWLEEGKEMCVSYSYNDLVYTAYFSDEKDGIIGSTPDEKWESLKKINSYLPDGHSERRTVVGWSYYDPDSGRFYHKGTVQAKIDFVYQASTTEDTLTFIVDSNLTTANGLYTRSEDTGLKNLNIEFRNGAAWTINGGTFDRAGDYQTSAALDVTRTEKMSRQNDFNRDVLAYGNLTLTGSGTLKVNVPDEERVLYGICANNISIKDNVSLDIKTTGNKFTYSGAGENGDGVKSAAIFCYGYLNIDTTGTVNIVCQKAPSKPNVNNPNSYNALDWIGERIYLTNAQSVTLNVVKKEDTFVTGGRYRQEHYNAFVSKARTGGWNVEESADDDSPYIVKLTRLGLYDADLTVGTQQPIRCSNGAIKNAEIQAAGSQQSLFIQVKVPKWLSAMYLSRINYDYTATVYDKTGSKLFTGSTGTGDFVLTTGGGTSTVTLKLADGKEFAPNVGDNYLVSFSITPRAYGGGKLESAAIRGYWNLTAVAKKEIVITSLSGNRSNISAGDSNPSIAFTAKAGDADVTLPAANVTVNWKNENGTALTGALEAGKIYTAEVEITAPDGYTFRGSSGSLPRVEVGNATKGVSGISCDGNKLYFTYTYQVPQAAHKHTLVTKYNAGYHWQECSGCGTVATSTRNAHTLTRWEGDTTQSRHCTGCGYTETRNIPGSELNAITNVVMDMKNYPVTGMRPHNFKHQDGDAEKYDEYILTYRDNSIVYPTFTLLSATGDVHMIAPKPEAYDFDTLADTADFASWSRIDGASTVPVTPGSKDGNGENAFRTGQKYYASIWLEAEDGYKFDSSFNSGNFTLLTDMDSAVITDYTVDAYYAITDEGESFARGEISTGTNASKIRLKVSMTAKNMGTLEITLPEIKAGDSLRDKWATFIGTPNYGDSNFVYACYGSDSMNWNSSLTKEIYAGTVAGDDITVAAGQPYTLTIPATQANAIPQISIKNPEVAASVTTNDGNSITVTYIVAAETPESTYIPAAEVTVTAPVAGEAPKSTATVPDGANYTVSDVIWSESPTAFEAGKSYKATVTVTPKTGYRFADGALFSINGNTVTGTPDGTAGAVTLSYTFPTLTAPHSHSYGDWKMLDDEYHYKICSGTIGTCDEPMKRELHQWSAWTNVDGNTHKRTCETAGCDAEQTADHNWVHTGTTDATFEQAGAENYKCSVCPATKSEPIAQLKKIDTAAVTVTAPVRNGTPSDAATKDSAETAYGVADTEWVAADGTVLDISNGDKFQPGTVYTVKIYLEATGSNRFTKDTKFTINGQPATVIPELSDGENTDSIILTYEFPATGTGSSSSGGTGSTTYTVKVLDSKNGDVTSSHKTAAKGTTVTLTVSPDKGYTLDDLTVLDKNDKEIKLTAKNGKYTFTMPASNVEVEATFKAAKSGNPFVDVPSGAYYEDAVIWAVEEGVTGGTSATTFDPNGICTRAQAVTFLWRAAGSPAPKSTTMPFTDVPAGSYYEQAVLWAVENGITKGTSDTTFSPNATCSRAQIVTFLWRSQKSPAAGSVNPFTDVKSDAYYADAVLWAVKENVTSGTTATTFSPNANCTRAQIVTFIYRALAE